MKLPKSSVKHSRWCTFNQKRKRSFLYDIEAPIFAATNVHSMFQRIFEIFNHTSNSIFLKENRKINILPLSTSYVFSFLIENKVKTIYAHRILLYYNYFIRL